MDGSVSTARIDSARPKLSVAGSHRAANEAAAQSDLFEQLLNLSFSVQPPAENGPESPGAETAITASSDRQDAQDVASADEEEDAPEEAIAAVSFTVVVPMAEEAAVAVQPAEPNSAKPAIEATIDSVTDADRLCDASALPGDATDQVTPYTDTAATDSLPPTQPEEPVATSQSGGLESTAAAPGNSNTTPPVPSVNLKLRQNPRSERSHGLSENPQQGGLTSEQPTEPVAKLEHDSTSASAPQAQSGPENFLEAAPSQHDSGENRRDEQRDKWFERSEESISETADRNEVSVEGVNRDHQDALSALPAHEPASPMEPAVELAVLNPGDGANSIASACPPSIPLASQTTLAPAGSTSAASSPANASPEPSNSAVGAPTRITGSQTAKADAKGNAPPPGLSQQERVRVIQRIARSFNRLSAEGGQINLRLHPAHLGSVSVQVRLDGRSLSARLSTETAAARDAILQDLPALRQRLADQGFDVTKFQVEVAGNGADASFSQSNGQPQSGQSENRSSGSQTDYRRVAANQKARPPAARPPLTAATLSWQAGNSLDLQA